MSSRNTKQQEAVRRALAESGRPLSPAEILTAAQREVSGLGLTTVYRVLKRLAEEGFAVLVPLPGEAPRYESSTAAAYHHHHFHCNDCGRVFDVPGCPKGLASMTPPGFQLSGHEVMLYGRCDACVGTGTG